MVGHMITCMVAYKSRMEYDGLDFDGDRPAQYKEIRKELAKLYEIEDVSLFGPVSLSSPAAPLEDISEEEKKEFLKSKKKENAQIQKGYQRVQEKVKEIRQSFSKAITAGTRSGSGKIVYEFYEDLVRIWGGYPSTRPLPCGVDTASLDNDDPVPGEATQGGANDQSVDIDHVNDDQDICSDANIATEETPAATSNMKRKAPNPVTKLIDNKRKHLEKTLSAGKRDQMLLNEAKEDIQFRKDLAEAMRQSTDSFTVALGNISSTMAQLGNGICQSIELLSRSMVGQQPQQHFQPGNQNNFYQNPHIYPSMGMTQGPFTSNEVRGTEPSFTSLTPPVQNHIPSSSGQQRFY